MLSVAHLIYGIALFVCLPIALRYRKNHSPLYFGMLILTVFALAYDNFAIGLGRVIGESDLLRSINTPRFVMHALFTPLMIPFALYLGRNANINWTKRPLTLILFGTLTLAMIALGVMVDIINLDLIFEPEGDIIRYGNEFAVGPPIPAIIAILVLIAVGGFIWRHQKWVWMFVGGIVMFIASAGGSTFGVFTNFGELILVITLILTTRNFPYINPT